MIYDVEAVPADGYEFSHWQMVGRKSNNPNDVFDVVYEEPGPAFPVDLTMQRNNGIKSPLVYLVAHFKPVEPETVEPKTSGCLDYTIENNGCCIATVTDLDAPDIEFISIGEITKDEILRALDDIMAAVEKIRGRIKE